MLKKTSIPAIVLAFIAAFGVDAAAQGPLGQILKRMDDHNRALTSLQADVTMVKHNPQLDVSDTSIGSTSYLPKTGSRVMYVRVDWTRPVEEKILVIGEKYELYRPRLNQVIYGEVKKAKNNASVGGALGFMSMSIDQLRANYTAVYLGEEQISGGTRTWHLQLTPKTATSYKTAELWVDGDGMPRQAKVIEQNDDSTTVLLANVRKNVTLKTNEVFNLGYPKTVKKVKA